MQLAFIYPVNFYLILDLLHTKYAIRGREAGRRA
jgi:hypothetical protein